MLKKLRKNKKGFTLVELIVVIVIILVLSAVMVPNVLKFIDKANQANTKSEGATMLVQVQAEVAEAYSTGNVATDINLNGITIKLLGTETSATPVALTINNKGDVAAQYVIGEDKDVVKFAYRDKQHWVTWTATEGWKLDGNAE